VGYEKIKRGSCFLLKAVVIQAFREYLVEMNAQGKDPLELKPILERLVCDVQKDT